MVRPVRVVLADDHPVLRAGLRALLEAEPDLVVVGEAGTGAEAVQQATTLQPDVTVMDLSMPDLGGLEAIRRITALELHTKVLVLTVHAADEHLFPALDAGASGYVSKSSADRELVRAIRTVGAGKVFLCPHAAKLLLLRYQTARFGDEPDPLERLTQRERDVLSLTAGGYSSSEIGERLSISPKTVDSYRARIMRKLEFHHRSELVRFALHSGLLKAL